MARITTKSPLKQDIDLVSFDILIEGTSIKDTYAVQHVVVTKELNKIASAEFSILDGKRAEEEFEAQDSGDFAPGKAIKIKAGYHQENEDLFKGIIVKTGIKVEGRKHPTLIVYCVDKAVKMTMNRNTKYYLDSKDSDVINEIAGNHGLEKEIESTTHQHKEIIQYHVTDWDFILTRAESNGLVVFTDNNKLFVKKPKVSGEADALLTMGTDIIKTSLHADARSQIKSVECNSWDMSQLKVVTGNSQEPSINSQGNNDVDGSTMAGHISDVPYLLHSTGPLPPNELKEWANARLLKSRLARIRGFIECQGTVNPVPNGLVELQGVGNYFNGNAFVSKVEHILESGNWITRIGVGLSPNWFIETIPNVHIQNAAGILPGIDGLYAGLVRQIHEDPDGETRVQIDVPVIDNQQEGIWARLSNLHATNNAGSFFMPEIGDEVVVGFLNNDPRYPVILGSLYSKKMPPPYTPDENNTVKAIVTKNQLKVIFEDEKKNIILETPAGNKITISDENKEIVIEDENQNIITMSQDGIAMDSPKDIIIKAKGKISLEATQDLSIKSQMNVKTEGQMNVENKANIKFSAQGSAQAELQSSGQTTVKGSIVMIN